MRDTGKPWSLARGEIGTCVRYLDYYAGAADNAVIVKPALLAPLTVLALAAHPGIDALTVTGSVPTGRQVLRAAAEHITPVVAELGGKSPQIVLEDADLDLAATQILTGICANTGQYCDAGSRLLVHHSVREQLVEELAQRMARLRIGPGAEDPDMGPLISAEGVSPKLVRVRPAILGR